MRRPATTAFLSVGLFLSVACGAGPSEAPGLEPQAEPTASTRYFPPTGGDWQTATPEAAGWSAEGLEAALEFAREQGSSSFVVAVGNRIVAERTWEMADARPRYSNMRFSSTRDGWPIEDVASAQKSVVSFLVGVARGKGILDLEAPASEYLGVGWSLADPDAERAILVRHLMSMSSGLNTAREYEVPAGEKWMYNTNVYSRVCQVLEAVSGMSLDEVTAAWLTERIGMSDSAWGPRPWIQAGSDANAVGFRTTARDLARFGVLVLEGGEWDGHDLLGDATYLSSSLTPSQEMNPAYGLLWWLNRAVGASMRGEATADPAPLIASAPADLVAAQGALGRKLYVVPSLDLVVTRLGDQPEPDFNEELWKRLISAAPPLR